MPKLEVEGAGVFEVELDKRLVLAIEQDAGVDIMHQCGSFAHCGTCRVEFLEGEPEEMTGEELMLLDRRNLLGEARISCQILCEDDMKVRPLMTMTSTGAKSPGHQPEDEITPEPVWVERPY